MPARPTIDAIAASASGRQLSRMCPHCRLRKGYVGYRRLCCPCFRDLAVRALYPRIKPGRSQAPPCRACQLWDALAQGLCLNCLRSSCPHRLADGECAECERQLRERLGIVKDDEEEKA